MFKGCKYSQKGGSHKSKNRLRVYSKMQSHAKAQRRKGYIDFLNIGLEGDRFLVSLPGIMPIPLLGGTNTTYRLA
jgi:hypothetical protein